MIKTVVRFHHWLPFDVYKLFLDDDDALGLVYWFEDVEKELWNSITKSQQDTYIKGLTPDQVKAHDLLHNEEHDINTGEWYLS